MPDFVFDPADSAFLAEPYPTYRTLREHFPAYCHPQTNVWLITRYADIERATLDFATFSSARGNAIQDLPQRVGNSLGSLDPPRHDQLRAIIQRGLRSNRAEAMLPSIRQDVADRFETLGSRRECDLVVDISKPVMFSVLGRLLGLTSEEGQVAARLASGIFRNDDGPMGAVMPASAFRAIVDFLDEHVQRSERSDDLISLMLNAMEEGAPLTRQQIVANMATVLLAGSASIGHFLPNLIHALWLHPDQRRLVLLDPNKILPAIDEGVRWDTSTQCFARQVTVEIEIGGTRIPAESRAVLFYASANRDERAFEDPDRFDMHRKRVRHFGFGNGPHVCAAAAISRVILKTVCQELLPRLGEYELDLSAARRVQHVMARGFVSLPIGW